MSYHYSAIPPFWELFDCPSYYIKLSRGHLILLCATILAGAEGKSTLQLDI
jgi:hypothetical protein